VSFGHWTHTSVAQQVVVGPSAVEGLSDVVRALGLRRVMVITTPGRAESEIGARVVQRLGRHLASTSTGVEPRVPANAVQQGVLEWRSAGADALLALGGGAAIDTAKAVAFFAEQEAGTPASGFADRPVIPVIAVPTTLVGAAFTGSFSMLDPHTRRSSVAGGPTTVPVAVLAELDPLADLDADGMFHSACAALAQAVDVAMDPASDPETRALSGAAIRALVAGLNEDDDEGPVSPSLLDGAVLAGRAMQTNPDGPQRALVRLLSARTDAAFGALHAATVRPTTQMLADVVSDEVLGDLARALGAEPGSALPAALGEVIGGDRPIVGLADLGLTDEDLDAVARQSTAQRGIQRAARPMGEADVRALLDDAC
jgi:maleylacetate reductase